MEEKEIPQIELLTPLTGKFFPVYGDEIMLTGKELARYEDDINDKICQENEMGFEYSITYNLMDDFYGSISIKEKVESAVISVKKIDGVLYGCTTLECYEFLEEPELQEISDFITRQYAYGWGEMFEQKDVLVEGGYIHVNFYQKENYKVEKRGKSEIEKNEPHKSEIKKPKMNLLGHDGNIFSIMGDAKKLLCRNGQSKEAEEMYRRVKESGSYNKALGIISEYVETELSTPLKPKRDTKKPERGESR